MTEAERVRCPGCGRTLARRLPDGSIEIRHGKRVRVVMRSGDVHCSPCSAVVAIGRTIPGPWPVVAA